MGRKYSALRVKKPVALLIISGFFVALYFVMGAYCSLELDNEVPMATHIIIWLGLLIPYIIVIFIFVDCITWNIYIEKNTITVRTVFYKKKYTYSQLAKIEAYFSKQYSQRALDLIFLDGRRVTIVENYRNFKKFRTELSKHKSFIIKN